MEHLPVWYLGQVPIVDCDKAYLEYMQIIAQDASLGTGGARRDHNIRNTTVRFAPKHNWFGDKMYQYGLLANKECKWDFDINDFEAVQFAEYRIDQKYNWHMDTFPLSGQPTDRKVTVVCMMSEPTDFEGGALQLRLYKEYVPIMTKGTIIAFPSFIEHQVTPVTKGIRYTATMWLSGPRFR